MKSNTQFGGKIVDITSRKIKNVGSQTNFLRHDERSEGKCEFEYYGEVTLTSLNSAPVTIIPDSDVPVGMKCYIDDFNIVEVAAAAAAGGTSVKIQDSNGTAVDFVTMAGTIGTTIPSGADIHPRYATGTFTREDALKKMTGGTAGKGLQWKGAGTFTGNCKLRYVIKGYFAP